MVRAKRMEAWRVAGPCANDVDPLVTTDKQAALDYCAFLRRKGRTALMARVYIEIPQQTTHDFVLGDVSKCPKGNPKHKNFLKVDARAARPEPAPFEISVSINRNAMRKIVEEALGSWFNPKYTSPLLRHAA